MKVKKFKKLLERYDDDVEISFYVKDFYSIHGIEGRVFGWNPNDTIWTGYRKIDNRLLIDIKLNDKETYSGTVKHPKITFRK